jgi:outer membrane cobalamin receptor
MRCHRIFLFNIFLIICSGLGSAVFAQEDSAVFDDDALLLEDEKGITVTGMQETTQEVRIITKEEITKANTNNMTTLLQETLNAGSTSYGGYGNKSGINLRGFDAKRIAFLIDGVQVNSAQSGDFDLNSIDPASIERIEVIYGGSDAKYNVSGALGGVVNIITVKKQTEGLRLDGSVSNTAFMPAPSFSHGKQTAAHNEDLVDSQNYTLSAALGAKNYSLKGSAFFNSAKNHFLYYDQYNIARRKDGNDILDGGINGSFMRKLDNDAKIIASASLYASDKNIPISGFTNIAGNQKDASTRETILFDAPEIFAQGLSAEASLGYQFSRLLYAPPNANAEADSRHDLTTVTAVNRWSYYRDALTLRSGFDWRFSYIDSSNLNTHLRNDGGFYVSAEWQALQKLLIIPSIKAVMAQTGSEHIVPVPKLGFLYNATESLAIKNNYFRSFKFPDFEDLYWSSGGMYGNPDLKSEDGWGADLGFDWLHNSVFSLGSVVFFEWTRDSVHWSNSSGTWKPENIGEAAYIGVDGRAELVLAIDAGIWKQFKLSVSYQYMTSRLLSYGYQWDSGKHIPYMGEHSIGGQTEINWIAGKQKRAGQLGITGHYEDIRYADTANAVKLDPYFLLTVNANQEISNMFAVFVALRNLLNVSYQSYAEYPMPGFNATIGLRFAYKNK